MLCRYCHADKPESAFYSYLRSMCKECRRKVAYVYRKRYRVRIKEYNRQYYLKHKERLKRVYDSYRHSHMNMYNAHGILKYYINKGEMTRPSCCEICHGKQQKIIGHHEDYDKPLRVIWVCPSCHKLIHHGWFKV